MSPGPRTIGPDVEELYFGFGETSQSATLGPTLRVSRDRGMTVLGAAGTKIVLDAETAHYLGVALIAAAARDA